MRRAGTRSHGLPAHLELGQVAGGPQCRGTVPPSTRRTPNALPVFDIEVMNSHAIHRSPDVVAACHGCQIRNVLRTSSTLFRPYGCRPG